MKLLKGSELAAFIKERQARQIRALKARGIQPKLTIFYDSSSPVIAKYMSLKERYGADIGVIVEKIQLPPDEVLAQRCLREKASDPSVHGLIVQLPLDHLSQDILKEIPASKDVDGLNGDHDTATASAIHWLLNAYGVNFKQKKIAIVGRGKLVGAPLARMWKASGYNATVFEKGDDLNRLQDFDLIVSATGQPALIQPSMLRQAAIVVDAGTASEDGIIKGDLAPTVYERDDLTLTPKIGGVGPLTVALLFDHLLRQL